MSRDFCSEQDQSIVLELSISACCALVFGETELMLKLMLFTDQSFRSILFFILELRNWYKIDSRNALTFILGIHIQQIQLSCTITSTMQKKSILGLSLLFLIALSGLINTVQSFTIHWDCVWDGVKFGGPVAACLALNVEDGEIACIKKIAGVYDFLSGCCSSFQNGTRAIEKDFEKACHKLGLA